MKIKQTTFFRELFTTFIQKFTFKILLKFFKFNISNYINLNLFKTNSYFVFLNFKMQVSTCTRKYLYMA